MGITSAVLLLVIGIRDKFGNILRGDGSPGSNPCDGPEGKRVPNCRAIQNELASSTDTTLYNTGGVSEIKDGGNDNCGGAYGAEKCLESE